METTDDQNGFFLVQLHLLSGDGERSVEPLFESVASLGGKGRWVKLKETKRSTKNKLFLDLIRQTPALKKKRHYLEDGRQQEVKKSPKLREFVL